MRRLSLSQMAGMKDGARRHKSSKTASLAAMVECGRDVILAGRRQTQQAHDQDGHSDRRRRTGGARARHRAAPGPGRAFRRHRRRSGARKALARCARVGDRGRGAAAVRDHGCLAQRRSGRAADPRHGGDRFQARRRAAPDLPDLRRRDRAGRAVRAHDRESAADRGADRHARRRWASSCCRSPVAHFENERRAASPSPCRTAKRSAAKLLVAADGARSAIREQAGITSFGWDYGQSGIVTTDRA